MTCKRMDDIPGRLHHFLLLDREQKAAVIRRLAAQGWQDHAIANFTGRAVEDIRRVLGEATAAEKQA